MADYGYGDAAPDSEKYAYDEAAPDSASRQANEHEYNKLGYGQDAPVDATNKYSYGAGSPDPSTNSNKYDNQDQFGYGEAAPDSDPQNKYGYEQATPEDQSSPYGYGSGNPDPPMNASTDDYRKQRYGQASGSNQENPYGYGDTSAGTNPYGDTSAGGNPYGYGDPPPDESAKYGYGDYDYTADYNDGSKQSGKEYRRKGRSKNRTHSHDGGMGGWDGLDTGSVHSTHTAESYGEYNSSGTDSESGAHHPPQRRQRYRRRGSVTKYSLEATETVRQQYDADGNPLPTGTANTMQPDQGGATNGGGDADVLMNTEVDVDMDKSHSAMSIHSDEDGGNSTDDDGNLSTDEAGAAKKKKKSRGRKLGRIVKKGVKAIGRRRASMDY